MFKALFSRRMGVIFLLGTISGIPLGALGTAMQAWMTDTGVDIKTIGLFAAVGTPYSIKFLWAPLMDRFTPPFLGRRRGWMLLMIVAMATLIASMSGVNPLEQPQTLAILSVATAFFSASFDIVFDAYKRDILEEKELGLGSSFGVNGYLIGYRYVAGALALVLADQIPWTQVYIVLGVIVLLGAGAVLWAEEPKIRVVPPRNLRESVILPLVDYFKRSGAIEMLLFILLYKVGDTMATSLATKFYKDIGFSNTEIGLISKAIGFWATPLGALIGGMVLLKIGIKRGLWIFGFLQAASTLVFAVLAQAGHNLYLYAFTVVFENLTAGMGTAAFVAFMASLTNKKFSATQYALLSSLMSVPRTLLAAPAGYLVVAFGYVNFFVFCTVIAGPAMILFWFRSKKWESSNS
jgi:MFS transporter, PAT family, beta-lactamase induction signal transducer AmpG